MLVVNYEKERVKIYLRSDVESNITNITHESNEIQMLMSQITQAMSGALSGVDNELIGKAQQALQSLSQALQSLYEARRLIDQLETREEVPDA